jgi:hypothetical protein
MKLENVEIVFKPYQYFNEIKIKNRIYLERVSSPNLFIIKNDETLMDGETINFITNNIKYTLHDILVNEEDDDKIIECTYWEERIIE